MRVFLAAVAVLTLSAPVLAQNTTAPAPAVAAKFTVDTPLEAIVADPAGKAVIDANMPGLTTHQMYEAFKGMSLKQLQPMSNGKITDAGLAKVGAALAAVK